MTRVVYPKNKWVMNSRIADIYFQFLRWRLRVFSRPLEWILGTEIRCSLPKNLFLPHPYGVIVGSHVVLEENVVLMQQVTLGGKDPHLGERNRENQYPIIEEGVYVGAGAKILGNVRIGAWSIIAANAVVLHDVPSYCIAGGIPARVLRTLKEES